ncbi:MAG TPA: amidohydrolase family protein [Anaerolineae bacterium]
MIVDVHAHLGRWPHAVREMTAAEMAAYMAHFGIDYTFVSSSTAVYYDFREGNREMAEAIRPFPQIKAYVTVNLNYVEESLAEISAYLGPARTGGPQFAGIKVHQQTNHQRFNMPAGFAIAGAAAEYGVPILIHTFSSAIESPWNVVPVAQAYPNVPFILGHMGGEAWWEGARCAREAANLYLELCSTYTDPPKATSAIAGAGVERVLFGTDASLFEPTHMLGALEDAGLDDGQRALVMGGNARRLFGLAA